MTQQAHQPHNVDHEEIQKFDDLASRFWDLEGELRTLHQINPLRMEFIQRFVELKGKVGADIGCGGGILTEALALAGAQMTGADLADSAIQVAKMHMKETGVEIDYRTTNGEQLAEEHPEHFDFITCMEMLEHVPDPNAVIQACAQCVKPGGVVFFSTLNRNLRSFIEAIVGAEYILGLIPKGTHTYDKFIKPEELTQMARDAGLTPIGSTGVYYNPLLKTMSLHDKIATNYILAFRK